jgi:lipopolysaccharide export system protein LptC
MSKLADQIRNKRQKVAAPGSRHDRKIRMLRVVLPSIIGALIALLAFTPFASRLELSFVLDKSKVEMASERMRINDAMYRGEDNKGQPFVVSAGSAVQKSSADRIIRMADLSAEIILPKGPAAVSAESGLYNMDSEIIESGGSLLVKAADGNLVRATSVVLELQTQMLQSKGPLQFNSKDGYTMMANNVSFALRTEIMRSIGMVTFTDKDGYKMTANNVEVNIPQKNMQSIGPVSGQTRIGSFSADSMNANLNSRIVTLTGNARLRINPKAIK